MWQFNVDIRIRSQQGNIITLRSFFCDGCKFLLVNIAAMTYDHSLRHRARQGALPNCVVFVCVLVALRCRCCLSACLSVCLSVT